MHDRFSDTELMERVRDHNDPEAFGALVARWRGRLRRYSRPLIVEPAAIDDAVQEVLVRVWSRRREYVARGRFEAYLLTLARHHWLNARRRERRRANVAIEEDAGSAGRSDGPEAAALVVDNRRRVAEAVAALPPPQREVFELVTGAGLRQEDVAARLRVPLGTVKSRLHAARARIRVALEDPDE